VHCNITNTVVKGVIDKVLGGRPIKTQAYPGKVFRASDGEKFEALIGTSNFYGIGHMLAQRKAQDQLGWKVIESIAVWCPCPEDFVAEYCAVVNITNKE
jgi:hypothetical protein